ncbi:uncharacterized protein B0H18DRAFT_1119825 [Fomitopsis serialis]|uniref:uncharacterized protein n=1 Tax=Fomitopsis serialis TaxID=139415 RepID=UPI002008AEE2|nr:uncharacterized protein B0H18DRAFT_1119825 [Neoantrodia serialis]KAH9924814.1 hypothetical protein B0H18DRAFT_1119825 [Neoantrodia serialis]
MHLSSPTDEAIRQSTPKVSQAPWTRWLVVEPSDLSPERRRFLIMLYIHRTTVGTVLKTRVRVDDEPLDFARNAAVVFARLPSGYFVLMVKSQDSEPGADDEYHTLIITAHVAFGIYEKTMAICWEQGDRVFSVTFRQSQDFWAVVACIRAARMDTDCSPELRSAREEAETLQDQLQHIEDTAFISVLEAATSTA